MRDVLCPTTTLAGPVSVSRVGGWRRVVLILACLLVYAAAATVLRAMPAVFAPRP